MSRTFHTPAQVIYVCTGDKCKKRGGKELGKLFRELVKDQHLKDRVEVIRTECTDRCKQGPIVCLQPANTWLYEVREQQARRIFMEQVLGAAIKPRQAQAGSDET